MAASLHRETQRTLARRAAAPLVLAALLALLGGLLASQSGTEAHPGSLDEFGGHFDEKTNLYHYHRPKAEMARRKREFLAWSEVGRTGELRGPVVKVERPDAIWVRIPYRPAYEEVARGLTAQNRNAKEQLVRVWFLHASPEASANRGRTYNQWFRKKVAYELNRKVRGKDVVVQFRIVQQGKRVFGMVLMGEENINLWLVLNGWSYYVLGQGENPFDKQFVQAEDIARKRKAGLWQQAR
jgi:endonuclease YncB( thermonuclease family)